MGPSGDDPADEWPSGLDWCTEEDVDTSLRDLTQARAIAYLDRIEADGLTWVKWGCLGDTKVIQLAALHNFLDPDKLGLTSPWSDGDADVETLFALDHALKGVPGNPIARLTSHLAVLNDGIEHGELSTWRKDEYPWDQLVKLKDFKIFMRRKGLAACRFTNPAARPPRARALADGWRHDTATLRLLDEACEFYRPKGEGGTYEPGDKSPDVETFLIARGLKPARAKKVASIIRPDVRLKGGAPTKKR